MTDPTTARLSDGPWRGRRVLVAGGTGFLGRRAVERLRELGARVDSCSRREGVDLRERAQAQAFMLARRPQVVLNFAADQGGVEYQRRRPATIFHDNMLIQLNTMEGARLAGVERYVNVLAGCIYPGNPAREVLREDDVFDGPMHESADNYGMTRRAAYVQARHYRRQYGLSVTSVVLANAYGPGDHFGDERSHAVAALLRRFYEARRDRRPRVEVWGAGHAERDWIYRDDAVDGVLLAAERWCGEGVLNVAGGRGVSTCELAETVREVTGYRGEIIYDATKPEGPLRKVLDGSLMRRQLGWSPPTALCDGLARTLAWLDAHYTEAIGG